MTVTINVGIVTVSDRASRGEYEDLGGPAIEAWLDSAITNNWSIIDCKSAGQTQCHSGLSGSSFSGHALLY